jgi:hypothetical protein
LVVVSAQGIAPLGYLRPALFKFFELYDPRLVGIHEPCLLPRETLQVTLELLCLSLLSVTVFRGGAGEILKLAQEPLGISH